MEPRAPGGDDPNVAARAATDEAAAPRSSNGRSVRGPGRLRRGIHRFVLDADPSERGSVRTTLLGIPSQATCTKRPRRGDVWPGWGPADDVPQHGTLERRWVHADPRPAAQPPDGWDAGGSDDVGGFVPGRADGPDSRMRLRFSKSTSADFRISRRIIGLSTR